MSTNSLKVSMAAMVAAVGLNLAATAQDVSLPPPATKTGLTYQADIKAIFDASCVKCHSGDRPKARLHMDTLPGIMKGTKEGPVVTPGDSAGSFLVKAVAHVTKDHDSWMPPLNNKAGIKPLTPGQIGLIRAWIDQGAK
jgi:hypothetical protein